MRVMCRRMGTQSSSGGGIQRSSKRGVHTVIRGGCYEFSFFSLIERAMVSRPMENITGLSRILNTILTLTIHHLLN
jgi:hypothetical protein